MNKLTITVDRDDYSVGLTGYLSIKEFSGHGEGWFNYSDISELSSTLMSISKNMEGTAELLGTQCKSDGSEYLERFCLRFYVLSKSKINGIIGVHVALSEYPYTDCREQEILKVSGELQMRNHQIADFAEKLNNLISGEINEVSLVEDLSHI